MHTASEVRPRSRLAGIWLTGLGMILIGSVAGCSSSGSSGASGAYSSSVARERGDYAPPGPASDPWGPYIKEASARFSVPELWIREVMRQESGGRQYIGGSLTTSRSGAAGLMQVMPATYAELRAKHGLGPDRYHPRDNIFAGTAYIREMYDRFGYPGFLAAYNAGPARLEGHLYDGRSLPAETRNYLASVAPRLAGSANATGQLAYYAGERSADDLNRRTMTALSNAGRTPADDLNRRWRGTTPPRSQTPTVSVASRPAPQPAPRRAPAQPSYAVASAAAPRPAAQPARQSVAALQPAASAQSGPGIQVGAFSSPALARAAADSARNRGGSLLSVAQVEVRPVTRADGVTLYRAWLVGLSPDRAAPACDTLARQGMACMVLTPETA